MKNFISDYGIQILITLTGIAIIYMIILANVMNDSGIVSDKAMNCNKYGCRVELVDGRHVSTRFTVLPGDKIVHYTGRNMWELEK